MARDRQEVVGPAWQGESAQAQVDPGPLAVQDYQEGEVPDLPVWAELGPRMEAEALHLVPLAF
jgi:hypothetical protein